MFRHVTLIQSLAIASVIAISATAWGQGQQCEANELAKLLPTPPEQNARFGCSVSISESTAVIGAMNAYNNGGTIYGEGAAYVFQYNGSVWLQVAELASSDRETDDEFGAVSISGDTIVVGAAMDDDNGGESGSAYVFVKPPDGWASVQSPIYETAKLLPSDGAAVDVFGCTVSIDGETVVIGAAGDDDGGSNSGSAYVFEEPAGGWGSVPSPINETAKLVACPAVSGDRLGVAVGIAANTIVVGADQHANGPGFASVFEEPIGGWGSVPSPICETARLLASDGQTGDDFGLGVSLYGDTVVVGAHRDDDAGSDSGSAYVFVKPAGGWVDMTEDAKLTASDAQAGDNFGISVSINDDDIVLVGAYAQRFQSNGPGAAYVFVEPSDGWESVASPICETAKLTASDGEAGDEFGAGVSISGTTVVIGATCDDDNGDASGSAYAFHGLSDCNGNATLDICEMAADPSADEDGNGILDECENLPEFVVIDIKPGSCPNVINLGALGVVPVAILSSETFDATLVDPETVVLSGAGVAVRGSANDYMTNERDVDGDGLIDLVVQVETINFQPDEFQDGYAILTGETDDGPFYGLDEITIMPPD